MKPFIMSNSVLSREILASHLATVYNLLLMCFTIRSKLPMVIILKIISFTFERPNANLEKLVALMSNKLHIADSHIA